MCIRDSCYYPIIKDEAAKMIYYVYILRCGDGSFYTGWTNDLKKRLTAHQEGRGAKYTRGRGPLQLVYTEEFDNKSEAIKREYHIKKMSRKEKETLIDS